MQAINTALLTKSAALRILSGVSIAATKIERVQELKSVICVVYLTDSGRCSRFVSKQAFIQDAQALREEGATQVSKLANGNRNVVYMSGSKGQVYRVDVQAQSCTCPDHVYRHTTCKHLIKAMQEMSSAA